MATKDSYHFGSLARRVDFYAYPRTGSHFLFYALSGLFDLVALAHDQLHNPEAVSRQSEINPQVLYALSLREDGVPYSPVYFNALRTGMHGAPDIDPATRTVALIRDPMAAAYSNYRVNRDRWRTLAGLDPAWLEQNLRQFIAFYANVPVAATSAQNFLLLRYEDLTASDAALRRLVEFVGVRPKLQPSLVHWLLRFDTMVKPGDRTFYRAGRNDAWRDDPDWLAALRKLPPDMDFSPLGYPTLSAYLRETPR